MLSRLVITFLPRSKRLLISWLQSPSAVILEPLKIKSATVSTVSPSICHEVTDQALFPSIARILNHWTSREVLAPHLLFPPTYHPTKSAHLHISLSIPQALLKLTGCQALCSVCFVLAAMHSSWTLTSPNRDCTHTLCSGIGAS